MEVIKTQIAPKLLRTAFHSASQLDDWQTECILLDASASAAFIISSCRSDVCLGLVSVTIVFVTDIVDIVLKTTLKPIRTHLDLFYLTIT